MCLQVEGLQVLPVLLTAFPESLATLRLPILPVLPPLLCHEGNGELFLLFRQPDMEK